MAPAQKLAAEEASLWIGIYVSIYISYTTTE